jgi:prophage antirepressor-like protein
LDIDNSRQAVSRLDEDEKITVILNDGNKGNPNQTAITESGLYSLVLSSRKPEAKTFKKWVTSEVLPQIRKTGSYQSQPKDDIDLLIESAVQLKMHRQRISALEAKQREAEAYMEQVEAEPIRTMHVTTRKALDALVKNYAVAKGVDVPKVYGLLYSQFDMRYKKNTRLNSKRQSLSMITWVEQNGWIAELYEVAKDIFSQPNKV